MGYFLPMLLPVFSSCYSFTMFCGLFSSTSLLNVSSITGCFPAQPLMSCNVNEKLQQSLRQIFTENKLLPGSWNHTGQIT